MQHFRPQLQVVHDLLVAQVQIPVLQADVFLGVLGLGNLKREFVSGFTQNVKFCDQNFDFSSSQVPVVGVFISLPDSSFDADDALLGKSFEQAIIIGYDLYRIRVVSQVQEQDAAMVADALYPAGKQDFLTGFAEIEVLALTSAVNVLLHMFVSFEQKYPYLPA